jgi:hypothetical protein
VSTLILERDGSGVTTLAVVGLRALANEASGHRGRASPSGRAGDHRRQAPSNVVLTGHAPNVPYASVGSGHPRTTTVSANALRAVGSAGTERSEEASQARGRPRWGRERAVNGRNASVNHGEPRPSSVQLTTPLRWSAAGHGHPPIRSRTEEVAQNVCMTGLLRESDTELSAHEHRLHAAPPRMA